MKIEDFRSKIADLIQKYERAKQSGLVKKYSEEETKKDFILPLFEALGWDVREKREVSAEEKISGDRVDYGFYIDGHIKFYLEAKPLRADIHKEEYAKQAIKYSWNKGVTWAVLTDFESLIVFNTQDVKASLASKLLFEIPYSEYLERFDQLSLLSRESFKENSIDDWAEKNGKKFQKVPITALLYNDLNECREMLTKSLVAWNPNLKKDRKLLDEGVQKLLDRLIFLRVAEDRGIEPPTLIPLLREWHSRKDKNEVPLYAHMVKKFRDLDKTYNSNLFSEHPFEKWEEYGDATEEVIKILYGKPGYYEYDFKVMPADILGTVYENYLGYKLSQSKKGIDVHKDAKKRKEQGIYYTPHFIVEYIVKNALGPVLDRCETIEDLKKVKVLDPACGSGSFLVQALELINEKYKRMGAPGNIFTKTQILLLNIFGVDLDEQAVEIARLNLLVSALDGKNPLPKLDQNIKCGNSLIYGTDAELKKYFGTTFKDQKPFNWEEEFPDVFEKGGFTVVIGNPPWGASIDKFNKSFYKDFFVSGKGIIDTFALFIERSLGLLKEEGYLGFILPDIVLLKNYPQIRKFILDNCLIKNLYYTGMAFHGVNLDSVIAILKKEKSEGKRNENYIEIIMDSREKRIKQQLFLNNSDYKFNLYFDDYIIKLKNKVDSQSIKLGGLLEIHEGIHSGNIRDKLFLDSRLSNKCQKLLFKGVEVERYFEKWGGKFVNYDKSIINKTAGNYANLGKEEYFLSKKILVRRTGDRIIATIDNDKYFVSNNFFVLYYKKSLKEEIDLKCILAILNSKLGTWYFTAIQPRKGKLFAEIKINHLAEIPISKKREFDKIFVLVDQMSESQKKFHITKENSNDWERLESEIEKTDKKIDEEIYKLYRLTPEEIKIVETTIKD
ncbi:MAG: hypothetical protein UY23_C0001G0363 [Candidatus Jorgensenbacteria bacterium GW2011_GWA1_48_11]|uniref:site-specific DNA-methyltransferase (adenine-specific) n=1 Tax=Candidatus Jorgensenbacteria bacterium GW2011_GWA1_48_11 TaxID=1618660 RepID=A0A0G1UCB1_9BACT|nr:MAG: hypothetical protein UY23_C0001G0363 [Candidatus Jorgensenbacteria bacterium GW2011_GWA1_48_11]KKW12248.1 MAG: hypothetical protein UY51_C0005G0490 [Candidatus Jorgensenbacteria bacterium GW2011_GWB1_49_9]